MGQLRSLFFWRAILAEFLGTTIYIAVALGVSLTWDGYKVDDHLRVALCFGLALAVVSYMFMPASGGHLNPAVTISCAIARRIPVLRAIAYLLVQCGGAITGAAIIYAMTQPNRRSSLGALSLRNGTTYWQGFGMEGVLGFMISFVYLSGTDPNREDASFGPGLAYGSANIAGHLLALPYTSCGMNPARALAPAVLMTHWPSYHWIYWAGPILGAIVAGLLYVLIFAVDENTYPVSANITASNDYIIERPLDLQSDKLGGSNGGFGSTSM
eukprot:Seg3438.2 transcript_id=Seg3438.2/GoldUCD/mRNA.D3Y31 product=Aquaporin-4 protein_id=Seg3438.2/GoldUCD/D3Y31